MKFLNNTNKKIIDSGCHLQWIDLKPHKILTHMLFDFLILWVIFFGMRCRFLFSALSFLIESVMTKDKLFSKFIIPYGGIKDMSSKIMDSVFINLSNYKIVSCRV